MVNKKGQGVLRKVRQAVSTVKQVRRNPVSKTFRMSFGGGALIAVLFAAFVLFVYSFWALSLIAWAASLVLGILGLFKDERKALAYIALSLTLALPVVLVVLFNLNCCGP